MPARTRDLAWEVTRRLSIAIPNPKCELAFANAWQLLVATILSAQSTDRMVNQVTPALFQRFPTPEALARAAQEDVENLVRRTGFFRNKAKAIREASQQLVEQYGGEVPKELDALVKLRGVARKTANTVLGAAYGIASGFIVDTHAGRVARRLKLTAHDDPKKVEQDLCNQFARNDWVDMGHRFVLHGRYVCLSKRPRCALCPLNEVCPSAEAPAVATLEERCRDESERIEGT